MIFTKSLEYQDIVKNIDIANDVITIIGCESCVRVSGSGGEHKMRELALSLKNDGYNVKDGFLVPSSCTPRVLFAKLSKDVNTVISLACGAGTANVMRCFPQCKVIEATKNIGLMVDNTDKDILKVTMPYKDFEDELGKEYETHTRIKKASDDALLISGVVK